MYYAFVNERLRRILDRVAFGEPLRSFFSPQLELVTGDTQVERDLIINLVTTTADSRPPHRQVRVKYPLRLSHADLEHMSDDQVLEHVRALVHHMMKHEADEALRVDGMRHWHPHDGSSDAMQPVTTTSEAAVAQREPDA